MQVRYESRNTQEIIRKLTKKVLIFRDRLAIPLNNLQLVEVGQALFDGGTVGVEAESAFLWFVSLSKFGCEIHGNVLFSSTPWSYSNPLNTWPLIFTVAWYANSASPLLIAVTLWHRKTAGARTLSGNERLTFASANQHKTNFAFASQFNRTKVQTILINNLRKGKGGAWRVEPVLAFCDGTETLGLLATEEDPEEPAGKPCLWFNFKKI